MSHSASCWNVRCEDCVHCSLQHPAGNGGSDTVGLFGCLQAAPDAVISTAVTALPPEEVLNRNRVKCIVDRAGYALYFSRGMLPHNK
jgi:hypothetical protein